MKPSLPIAGALSLLLAAACGGSAPDGSAAQSSEALGTSSVGADIVAIAGGLTGDRGPFTDKAYWLSGKDPAGAACRVTLSRNDAAFVAATISEVGSNPPAEMGFSLFASNPVSVPVVDLKATAGSFAAAVKVTEDGSSSTNAIEAKFAGDGGYEGLRSVRIFTDSHPAGKASSHVERTCSSLAPLLTVDTKAEGPRLAKIARAYYEAHHATRLADPVDLLACGFGDAADRVVCTFDVGTGNDDQDIPPDQLEVTFTVAHRTIGQPVAASLDGE